MKLAIYLYLIFFIANNLIASEKEVFSKDITDNCESVCRQNFEKEKQTNRKLTDSELKQLWERYNKCLRKCIRKQESHR